ncbi:MAG: hypothetical protein AAGM67_20825, partial [Bacteroidota bacterium]
MTKVKQEGFTEEQRKKVFSVLYEYHQKELPLVGIQLSKLTGIEKDVLIPGMLKLWEDKAGIGRDSVVPHAPEYDLYWLTDLGLREARKYELPPLIPIEIVLITNEKGQWTAHGSTWNSSEDTLDDLVGNDW